MKTAIVSFVLIASLTANAVLVYVVSSIQPAYEIPNFNYGEYEVAQKIYASITEAGNYPVNDYLQSIETLPEGYKAKMCTLQYLQVVATAIGSGSISDGCICYTLNSEFELQNEGMWC